MMATLKHTWRILVADNLADFVDTRAEVLESAGYHALRAYTLDQARQMLLERYVHLALIDIRLVDDDDALDVSGLLLARDPLFHRVPKIIVTGHPTYQAVRQALGPVAEGLPPAVDFMCKEEGLEAMLEAVQRAIANHIGIYGDARITWPSHALLSFYHIARLLEPDLTDHLLTERSDELADLCSRLFAPTQQIRVVSSPWHDGGRICLQVLTQAEHGVTNLRLVVCGRQPVVAHEAELVRDLAPVAHNPHLISSAETVRYGGLLFELPGVHAGALRSLRETIEDGRRKPLRDIIDSLLDDVLPAWHQRSADSVDSANLLSNYHRLARLPEDDENRLQLSRCVDALVQTVRALSAVDVEREAGSITFFFPPNTCLKCPDPVDLVYERLGSHSSAAIRRVSPGHLTADNILVDDNQHAWVTDLAEINLVPELWDFVCLEAIIRFAPSEVDDLLAWDDLEAHLVSPDSLHAHLVEREVDARLATTVHLVERIRRRAGSEAGPRALPYYTGLLVWVVASLATYDVDALHTPPEQWRYAHLLLAAAHLARRIKTLVQDEVRVPVPEAGPLPRPRLDDRGGLWLGEQLAGYLIGQDLALYRLLDRHPGELVDRGTLYEALGDDSEVEAYSATDSQEARLNTAMGRLRSTLLELTRRDDSIETLRNRGYRLGW